MPWVEVSGLGFRVQLPLFRISGFLVPKGPKVYGFQGDEGFKGFGLGFEVSRVSGVSGAWVARTQGLMG